MPRALSLVLLLVCACQHGWTDTGSEAEGAIHTRSFDLAAGSLILSEHGERGVMSADDLVSAFDTSDGSGLAITAPGAFTAPMVEDWVGERVAIVDRSTGGGVYLWNPEDLSYDEQVDEEAGGSASLARGWDGGLAWVARRGDTCRFLRDGLPTANYEACGYIRDAAVIPGDGTLFLGRDDDQGGQEVLRLDPDGAITSLAAPIDLLDWDDSLQSLYAAEPGATQVQALTAAGGPVFTLDVGAPILDLAALDGANALAVLAGEGEDVRLHLYDAIRGEELTSLDTSPSSNSLAASGDGSTIAIVQPDRMVVITVDWVALAEDTGS